MLSYYGMRFFAARYFHTGYFQAAGSTSSTTVKIEDRVLLGQSQSIETPASPSIGGSTTWS